MNRTMTKIGQQLNLHTKSLELSILKAWDETLVKIDNKLTELITNDTLNYNTFDRIQYAFQRNGNIIDQSLDSKKEKIVEAVTVSINEFERKIRSLALEEKQQWILTQKFDGNALSDLDWQMYQSLQSFLTQEERQYNTDDPDQKMDLLERIGTYVFQADVPISMVYGFGNIIEPGFFQILKNRVRIRPEVLLQGTKKEIMKQLYSVRREDIIKKYVACYLERSETIQKLLSRSHC